MEETNNIRIVTLDHLQHTFGSQFVAVALDQHWAAQQQAPDDLARDVEIRIFYFYNLGRFGVGRIVNWDD